MNLNQCDAYPGNNCPEAFIARKIFSTCRRHYRASSFLTSTTRSVRGQYVES
ncbi:hypothetical protein J6590_060867 [Homalodisca vitripennis]|nr:hypothetical protein J6590_060867 [Homalodisca vitripennis]